MSSVRKLDEAAFFIELLHALEQRGDSLTHLEDSDSEASFLYAAILNAFYSTTEIMRFEGLDTRSFRSKFPEIYADGSRGGERAKTVHIRHIEASGQSTHPDPLNIHLAFRPKPKLSPTPTLNSHQVVLRLTPKFQFFVQLQDKHVHALEFCEGHLAELRRYHASARAT